MRLNLQKDRLRKLIKLLNREVQLVLQQKGQSKKFHKSKMKNMFHRTLTFSTSNQYPSLNSSTDLLKVITILEVQQWITPNSATNSSKVKLSLYDLFLNHTDSYTLILMIGTSFGSVYPENHISTKD